MMDHLLNALDRGDDIGHYGRLVFVMVARHFCDRETLVKVLTRDATFSEEEARALVHQVEEADYSPPKREKILEFQRHQKFPIIQHPEDPDYGNVYKHLHFPDRIYEHITEYHVAKTHAEE